MSLAQFGFRMVTPAEEEARRRKQAACNHLEHADHTTIQYSTHAGILSAHDDYRTGLTYVTCRKCGASWAAASVTQLGARRIATNLRKKCQGRILDADTKAHFRMMAKGWDDIARGRS